MPTVRKGTRFRSAYADTNALWEVRSVRSDICDCVIVDEPWEHNGVTYPGDYAGVRKPFYIELVQQAVSAESRFEADQQLGRDWFDSLEPGTIVHYHDAFGRFIRCEAVRLDVGMVGNFDREYVPGEIVLRELALVGSWKPNDLPRTVLISWADAAKYPERKAWKVNPGSEDDTWAFEITYCYHAGKIADGSVWRPHYKNMWEASDDLQARFPDVPGLKALSLDAADNVLDQRRVAA